MSRIAKNSIKISNDINCNFNDGIFLAKGKLGELSAQFTHDVEVTQEDNLVYVKPRNDSREARKMWGTSKSIISNLVVGVSEGFTRKLEINGVGYRAQVQGKTLNLQLGFSHDVNYPIPEGIEIKCADQTQIEIFGANKQRVGQVAAEIRAYRPPEPYKGKGIKYDDEYILRKEGKKK